MAALIINFEDEADEEALIEGSCLIKSFIMATSERSCCLILGGLSLNTFSSVDGIPPSPYRPYPCLLS